MLLRQRSPRGLLEQQRTRGPGRHAHRIALVSTGADDTTKHRPPPPRRLTEELELARAEGSNGKLMQTVARIDLLILGEWGLAPLGDCARRDLLELIAEPYLLSTKATRLLWSTPLGSAERVVLRFERETRGLPTELHAKHADRFVGVPMHSPRVRSLYLSTSVAPGCARCCGSSGRGTYWGAASNRRRLPTTLRPSCPSIPCAPLHSFSR
ncbi:MAG: ATP-binding protein [Gemmatimonadetes bacterium]|nr:ATP-binding protein [Gemmatimonadota bacterium]